MQLHEAKTYAFARRKEAGNESEWKRWQGVLARLASARAVTKLNAVSECEQHKEEQDAKRSRTA